MKKTPFVLILLMGLFNHSFTQAKDRLGNVIEIINGISVLAKEFNLTNYQKNEVRSILINYLPNIVLKTSAMINNRNNLLASNLTRKVENDDYMFEIAKQQGLLLTDIIILKEHMKKEIKILLTNDQQNFVEDLLTMIIQYRINYS